MRLDSGHGAGDVVLFETGASMSEADRLQAAGLCRGRSRGEQAFSDLPFLTRALQYRLLAC
jgi:hypothetical protein